MDIIEILKERKQTVLDKWFQDVAESYPEETTQFLGRKGDPFANPLGHALRQGLGGLLEGLLSDVQPDDLAPHLDEIVRIRAVQEFSPSVAVRFIFSLKKIVHSVCGEEQPQGLENFDAAVDRLSLLAFDNYMACRERLFEIKVKELRDMVAIQTRNMWKATAAQGGGKASNKEPAGGQ
jgi:hypothetical protein